MSLEENALKEPSQNYTNVVGKQHSAADIPDFRVGFLEFLEEDKQNMEKDKHEQDHSGREVDFIVSERSSNTMKKTKYEGKKV